MGCHANIPYLVPAPSRVADDVDDGTPAAGALVLTVVMVSAVVVVLRSHLQTGCSRHVEQYLTTVLTKKNTNVELTHFFVFVPLNYEHFRAFKYEYNFTGKNSYLNVADSPSACGNDVADPACTSPRRHSEPHG